jgi:hypothetical protein
MMDFTSKQLHELFEYRQDTGKVFWKECPDWLYDTNFARKNHITKHFGKEIKGADKNGYYRVSVNRKKYPLTHIIWKMVYDKEPPHIEHIDGNKQNNKISNLREYGCLQNMKL